MPVPKKEAMKTELDQMVADEIVTPVTEPTDWVSSVLAVPSSSLPLTKVFSILDGR